MATTKPPHNGAQATEDLLEVEVFKGNPNTLIVKDEPLGRELVRGFHRIRSVAEGIGPVKNV